MAAKKTSYAFAGSVTFKGKVATGLPNQVVTAGKGWTNVFASGKTALKTSKAVTEWIREAAGAKAGDVLKFDVSISSEDEIKVVGKPTGDAYRTITFDGDGASVKGVYAARAEFPGIVAVRQAEAGKFGVPVIRVDLA